MITVGQLQEMEEGERLRTLQSSGLPELDGRPRLLWHCGYYDGALSGVCRPDDVPLWFAMVDEVPFRDADGEPRLGRVFAVCRIAPGQWRAERVHHAIWRACVGTHCDYDEDNCRKRGPSPPANFIMRLISRVNARWNWHIWRWLVDRSPWKYLRDFDDAEVVCWWKHAIWSFDGALFDAMEEKGISLDDAMEAREADGGELVEAEVSDVV